LLAVVHREDFQESSIALEKSYVSKPKIRGGERRRAIS
jgi:hypothetical protein